MEIRREVLRACAGWETVGGIRDLVRKGCLETRFLDGVGWQYRATGKTPPGRDRWVQTAVLEALESGPMGIRALEEATGACRASIYRALRDLTAKGVLVRGGRPLVWRLAP